MTDASWHKPSWRMRIGWRMAVLVIAFSSVVALVLSAVQLRVDYLQSEAQIDRQLDEIGNYVNVVASSAWAFDEKLVVAALAGFVRQPDILSATVRLSQLGQTWTEGSAHGQDLITRDFPLLEPGSEHEFGRLTIVASRDRIKAKIGRQAVSLLMVNGLTLLSLAGFLLYLSRRLITRRLGTLAGKVDALRSTLASGIEPGEAPRPDTDGHDEIAALEWVVERTRDALQNASDAREQSRAHIASLNQRLTALLDAAIETSIIATDVEGRITHFSRGAELMLGYTAEEMLGHSPAEFHRASEVQQRGRELSRQLGRPIDGFETFIALASTGKSEVRNWTYIRKDGQTLRVSLVVTAMRDPRDAIIGYLGIARDITEQLAAEAKQLKLTLSLDNQVKERTRALEESGAQLRATLDNLQATQARLVESEKLAALGSIVAAIAHELNTPIGNCVTVASTLQEQNEVFIRLVNEGQLKKSSLTEYLRVSSEAMTLIVNGLARCATLVDRFKQVAVNHVGYERLQFDLCELLRRLALVAERRLAGQAHTLSMSLPDHLPMDSFPQAIEQLLTQMFDNALVHGLAGRTQGKLSLKVDVVDGWVKMECADDGAGMDEQTRRRVFDPFFTTRLGKGSSGLGMYIAYNLASSVLGGAIDVTSAPDAGTRFLVRIPCVAPRQAARS